MTRHQYEISAVVPQTSFCGEATCSVAKCRLFLYGDWCGEFVSGYLDLKGWVGFGPSSSHNIVANGPTVSLPHPKFTLTSHLGKNFGLGEGWLGSFPESYTDSRTLPLDPPLLQWVCVYMKAQILAKRKLSVNVDVAYVWCIFWLVFINFMN